MQIPSCLGLRLRHLRLPLIRHLCAAAFALAASGTAAAELVVIVSANNPVPQLSGEQVAAIFLGQAGSFPGGAAAVALDQRLGSHERDQFYSQVTGKSPALLKAHWSKMLFTGRGQPPREVADNAAVRRMVAANPSMIGYIERSSLDASVRPVLQLR